MSHIPPLDPMVAARKGFRELEDRTRRFWKEVTVAPHGDDGWAVLLDGRTPKTPAKAPLVLPTEAAARLVADEWAAQGEFLDPHAMPATRLASTAIDRIGQAREPVADEIAAYAGTDVVCYLAEHPTPLVKRQEAAWTPWREWAAREMGVVLTIDDFGEGYSALNYLRTLPIHGLKLSQLFISGVPDNPSDVAVCEAVCGIARSLGLGLVAEGIESEAQRQFLLGLGVPVGQGFLFAPGLSPPDFSRRLTRAELAGPTPHV